MQHRRDKGRRRPRDEDLEGMTGAGGGFSLSEYIDGISAGWPEGDIARWIVCGLPLDFHALSAAEQREALRVRSARVG